MIALKTMEVCAFMFGSVNVMEGVMGEIVAKIANHEAKPKGEVKMLVIEVDNAVDGKVASQDGEEGKGWRVHNAVTKSRT